MTDLSPEEIELHKKRRVVERLETKLAEREEAMIELREDLKIFDARYNQEVVRFCAELDELEAEIATEEARLAPDDWEIQRKADEAKRRAEASAAAANEELHNCHSTSHKFNPSPHLKKAYFRLAKLIHPDLATSAEERERRNLLMAEANDAYAAGDESSLFNLLDDNRDSPDLITGDSIAELLIKAIRQIYQAKRRLEVLTAERATIEAAENYQLKIKVEQEMRTGKNLLTQMSERTKTHIKRARRRLENLKQNTAVFDVDEHYEMNVSMFR